MRVQIGKPPPRARRWATTLDITKETQPAPSRNRHAAILCSAPLLRGGPGDPRHPRTPVLIRPYETRDLQHAVDIWFGSWTATFPWLAPPWPYEGWRSRFEAKLAQGSHRVHGGGARASCWLRVAFREHRSPRPALRPSGCPKSWNWHGALEPHKSALPARASPRYAAGQCWGTSLLREARLSQRPRRNQQGQWSAERRVRMGPGRVTIILREVAGSDPHHWGSPFCWNFIKASDRNRTPPGTTSFFGRGGAGGAEGAPATCCAADISWVNA